MSTHDFVCIVGAICGFTMVAGGIFLLYKGSITLDSKPVPEALQVEFRRMFKISTQYPALGLFIIGLIFIASAINSTSNPSLRIRATLEPTSATLRPSDVTFKVFVRPWMGQPSSSGDLTAEVSLPMNWMVEVTAPGYKPSIHEITSPPMFGQYELKGISLEQIVQQPSLEGQTIVPAPASLPTLNSPFVF